MEQREASQQRNNIMLAEEERGERENHGPDQTLMYAYVFQFKCSDSNVSGTTSQSSPPKHLVFWDILAGEGWRVRSSIGRSPHLVILRKGTQIRNDLRQWAQTFLPANVLAQVN